MLDLEPMETNDMFYDAFGVKMQAELPTLVGEAKPAVVNAAKQKEKEVDPIMAELARLQAELAKLQAAPQVDAEAEDWAAALGGSAAKAEVVGKVDSRGRKAVGAKSGRTYQRLSAALADWGKVPQQQADLAKLFAEACEVGKAVSEEALYAYLTSNGDRFESLRKSTMSATYLWSYYRSFSKKDQVHGSFIRRNYLRMNG
jgi:hypothetical protein